MEKEIKSTPGQNIHQQASAKAATEGGKARTNGSAGPSVTGGNIHQQMMNGGGGQLNGTASRHNIGLEPKVDSKVKEEIEPTETTDPKKTGEAIVETQGKEPVEGEEVQTTEAGDETTDPKKAGAEDPKAKAKRLAQLVEVDGKKVTIGELIRKAKLSEGLDERKKQSDLWLARQKELLADQKRRQEKEAAKPKHPWDRITTEVLLEKMGEAKEGGDEDLASQIKNFIGVRRLRAEIKAELEEDYNDPLKQEKEIAKYHGIMTAQFPELGQNESELNLIFQRDIMGNAELKKLIEAHPSGWLWAAHASRIVQQRRKQAGEIKTLTEKNKQLTEENRRLSEKAGLGGTPAAGRGKGESGEDWRKMAPEQRSEYFRRKFEKK